MDKLHSSYGPAETIVTVAAQFVRQVAVAEHVAMLENPGRFALLRRKNDLLDEGVAAVFGLTDAAAEFLALCFQVGKFTPAETAKWLAERGFVPLLCVAKAA
jgi:hypothetical protein